MVAQQRKEIGIRMALDVGRESGPLHHRVDRAAAWTSEHCSVWRARGPRRVLAAVAFQVRPTDAVVYVVPLIMIAGGGFIATLLPAWKAARVDPLETLRSE